MDGKKTSKKFRLGDILENPYIPFGKMLVTDIDNNYIQVIFIDGKLDGSTMKFVNFETYDKIENIFDGGKK